MTIFGASQCSAFADTLQYEATIDPNGKVQVQQKAAAAMKPPMTPSDNLFIVKDQGGAVKGIFATQAQVLSKPLMAGDTVETLATVGDFASPSASSAVDTGSMQEVARQVAQNLLEQARSTMCALPVRPQTFTTGAEVGISFFAGTKLQVSATWVSADVCTSTKP